MSSACCGILLPGRFRRALDSLPSLISVCALLGAACCVTACGGGGNSGSGGGTNPPPPDFTITVPAQVTIQAGGVPQPVVVSDGGSDNNLPIQISISGIAGGLNLYGGTTFTFAGNAQETSQAIYTWDLGASGNAPVGSTAVTFTATNGSVTHTYTLNVSVTAPAGFGISLSQSSVVLASGGSGTLQATITGSNPPANPQVSLFSYPAGLLFVQSSIQSTGPETFNISLTAPLGLSAVSNLQFFVGAYTQSTASMAVASLFLNITQPYAAITAPTRSTIVRAGASPRSAVYDQARKLVFVAYDLLNEVVAYSSVDQHMVATIPVSQYQTTSQFGGTIDESPDGTRLYVAGPGKITIVDPSRLQVVGTQILPYTPAGAGSAYVGPAELVTLGDGNLLILNYDNHVYLWNTTTGSITRDDPVAPATVSFNENLVRSADHSTALLYGLGGGAILFYSGSDSYGASMSSTGGEMVLSPDGTRIALACSFNLEIPPVNITVYNDDFQPIAASPQAPTSCYGGAMDFAYPIFSLDGSTLYIFFGPGYGAAYHTASLTPLGLFSASATPAVRFPLTIDESGLVYGGDPGTSTLAVADASHPGALGPDPAYGDSTGAFPLPYPDFPSPYAVPNTPAPLSQSSPEKIAGRGFDSANSYSVFVGPPPGDPRAMQASAVSVASPDELDFTTPAISTPGPVNITVTRSDGWNQVLPDALTFGPWLLGVDPSAVPASQPTTEQVYGYGMGVGSATVGGYPATVEGVTASQQLNLFYPIEEMPLQTSAATPGWGDVVFSSPTGSSTLHHAMQFLKSSQSYPLAGSPNSVCYDQVHQRVYVSNPTANNVAVFDLGTSAFLTPIAVGKRPTSMALTPDNSTLSVLNSADQTVSIINTAQLSVSATVQAVTNAEKSGDLAIATQLAALGSHQVFVALTGSSYAHVLDLVSGTLSCTGIVGCDGTGVALQFGFWPVQAASTPDGSHIVADDTLGHMALLNVTQNTLKVSNSLEITGPLAADAGADLLAQGLAVYDANLNAVTAFGGQDFYYFPGYQEGQLIESASNVLNASGSLLFAGMVQSSATEIYALDVRHGNVALRIALPEQDRDVNGIALDETGTKLFLATTTALQIVQLYEAPLSIASVTPAAGSSGTAVTIRGSGFESGTTVSFGSTPASVEFTDAMTLKATVPTIASGPVQITVTNPDGSSYSLDDAFVEN